MNRKLERKNELEKKRVEAAQRKAQLKAAYDEELSQIESAKIVAKSSKVTRTQIQNHVTRTEEKKETPERGPTHLEIQIQENVNRLEIEGDEARNIDEAISILK